MEIRPARTDDQDGFGELYGADLARVHHEHFGAVAEAASREMLRRLADRGVRSGVVVDLALGSGRLGRRALEAGFGVAGVDLSPHMLRLARAHAPGAHLVRASLWDFHLPSCVAVAAVGEAFNYASGSSVPDVPRLEERFGSIAQAIDPGGLLLFDVAGPGRSGATGTRQVLWEKGRDLVFFAETEAPDSTHLERTVQTFVPVGGLFRRSKETHRLVLYRPEEVTGALARAGFSFERLDAYHDLEPAPGWHVFAATRRA